MAGSRRRTPSTDADSGANREFRSFSASCRVPLHFLPETWLQDPRPSSTPGVRRGSYGVVGALGALRTHADASCDVDRTPYAIRSVVIGSHDQLAGQSAALVHLREQ